MLYKHPIQVYNHYNRPGSEILRKLSKWHIHGHSNYLQIFIMQKIHSAYSYTSHITNSVSTRFYNLSID